MKTDQKVLRMKDLHSGGEAQSKHKEGFDPLFGLLCVNQLAFGMEPARRFAP
jgi:hypothetical protein